MKKLSNLFTLLFLIITIYYLVENPDVFNIFSKLSFTFIFLLIFVKFLTLCVNGLFNKILMKSFNVNLSNLESIYVSSITYLGNLYLPGRVGAGLRLAYFKQNYKIKNSYLLTIFSYFFIVSLFINSFFGLLSLVIISEFNYYISYVWIFLFLSTLLITFYLLIMRFNLEISVNKFKVIKKISSFIHDSKEGWNRVITIKNRNLYLVSIYLLNYLLFILEIVLIFFFVYDSFNITNLIFYNSISVFSNLISITPASLGFKELLIIGSTDLINLNSESLIQILLIERTIAILFSLVPLIITSLNNKNIKK
tara:strand:- start:11024 stop:11950 length:927 start_codon:yes stop_codon:yes gene_type:complete